MTIKELYKKVLNAEYIQLEEQTASFAVELTDNGRSLFLYFEWSNGYTDWKNNFDFICKPYNDMTACWFVHRGFLRVWKAIENEIADIIKDKKVQRIIIAGYSHGAAIAGLCTEYCVFNRPDIAENIFGYGYEAPRFVWGVLNPAVKKRFRHFYPIRNGRDIITRLPPVFFGYRTVGFLIKIGKKSKYRPIEAHAPENVIASLEADEKGNIEIGTEIPFKKSFFLAEIL